MKKKYRKPSLKEKKIVISFMRRKNDFFDFLNVYASSGATCDVGGCGNCWP